MRKFFRIILYPAYIAVFVISFPFAILVTIFDWLYEDIDLYG